MRWLAARWRRAPRRRWCRGCGSTRRGGGTGRPAAATRRPRAGRCRTARRARGRRRLTASRSTPVRTMPLSGKRRASCSPNRAWRDEGRAGPGGSGGGLDAGGLADAGAHGVGEQLDRVLDVEPLLGLALEVAGEGELDAEADEVGGLDLEVVGDAAALDAQEAGGDGGVAVLALALAELEGGQLLLEVEQLGARAGDDAAAVARGDEHGLVVGDDDREGPRGGDRGGGDLVRLGVADPQVPAVVRDLAVDVLLAARVDEVGGLAADHLDHAGAQVADVDAGLLVDADRGEDDVLVVVADVRLAGQRVEDLGLDEREEHAREAADQELVAGLEVLAVLDRRCRRAGGRSAGRARAAR
jgi:hypothetical protein